MNTLPRMKEKAIKLETDLLMVLSRLGHILISKILLSFTTPAKATWAGVPSAISGI